MADRNIVATDIAVTVDDRWFSGRKRFSTGTLSITKAVGDGSDSLIYPVAGVPLPAIGKFGMPREMFHLAILGTKTANPETFIWLYNKKTNKLLLYEYQASSGAFVEPVLEVIIVLPEWKNFSLEFLAIGS